MSKFIDKQFALQKAIRDKNKTYDDRKIELEALKTNLQNVIKGHSNINQAHIAIMNAKDLDLDDRKYVIQSSMQSQVGYADDILVSMSKVNRMCDEYGVDNMFDTTSKSYESITHQAADYDSAITKHAAEHRQKQKEKTAERELPEIDGIDGDDLSVTMSDIEMNI